MDFKELCFKLSDVPATSGAEKGLSDILIDILSEYMACKSDSLGNVSGTCGKGQLHILIDAHIDQVGLVVREIDSEGFVLIDKIGSVDLRILTGSEVIVHGAEDCFGVICSVPPHLQSGDSGEELNIKSMAVDIGMSAETARKVISVGDRITMKYSHGELLNNCISAASLDNSAGIAAVLGAIDIVKNKLSNVKLSVLFSVQEEVGCRGAGCGAFALKPDCAIVVDVGFGDDIYTDKALTISLGKGPSIGFAPILDKKLTDELTSIAESKNIPFQHDVMCRTTGTNADTISVIGAGVPTALLSVPLRYMHTANEIVNLSDVENTAKLIAEFILKKEAEYNA